MRKHYKLYSLLAALICLALVLTGCGKSTESDEIPEDLTFATGSLINGLDVSLLSAEDAAEYLKSSLADYSLTVTAGGWSATLDSAALNLQYNEETDLAALLQEQAERGTLVFTVDTLFTYDLSGLSQTLEAYNTQLEADAQNLMAETLAALTQAEETGAEASEEAVPEEEPNTTIEVPDPYAAQNAALTFDESAGAFVITPDANSKYLDADAIVAQAEAAVAALQPELVLDEADCTASAEITAEDPTLLSGLEDANAALALEISYTFAPEGKEAATEVLGRDTLISLFQVEPDGLSVAVDEEVLGNYVTQLASDHSVTNNSTQFKTTGGSYITLRVSSAGQSVDSNALYDDLLAHLNARESGTYDAPYAEADDNNADNAWGGNYVEVDLTNQKLWCYRNGECVVSCSIVSGCVANGTTTPTGCFTIFAKDYDRYLKGNNVDGSTYNAHVQYFMPFSGGCGIHDATWRSNFGGSIYLYNGSHGCVGVTLSNAKTIYNNVEVGTHVIVYGGATSVEGLKQSLSAKVSDTLTVGSTETIQLTGNQTTPTYSSSDSKVVTVNSDGKVTAVGVGTATITISCPESAKYKAATITVTIKVTEAKPDPVNQSLSASVTSSLTVGETAAIKLSGNKTAPSYSSSNSKVATVSSDGKVTAVGAGTATITISCPANDQYNAATATVTVTVSEAKPDPVDQSLSASVTGSLTVGETAAIKLSGNKTTPSYSSSDSKVVTVSSDGKVTAMGAGTATITISCPANDQYNAASTTVTITVSEPVPEQPEPPEPPEQPETPENPE